MPNEKNELVNRPEAENLLRIYSSLLNQSLDDSVKSFKGKNFSNFKDTLSQVLVEKIEPISIEINKLLNDLSHLDKILLEGSNKANELASKKIDKTKKLIGF